MKNFENKVAIVTGAASGIGLGLAIECLSRKMSVVLADVESQALERSASDLSDRFPGTSIVPIETDVSDAESVRSLAESAFSQFGMVHLLFNNAGVASQGSPWEATLDDWRWVMGVNLWGVIHGVQSFTPRMLESGEQGWIVNTGSLAGLVYGSGPATYAVTKHAVVALSEDLYFHLRRRRANIGVSVLCPGLVRTNIMDSVRNRPEVLDDRFVPPETPERTRNQAQLASAVDAAMTPEALSKHVFDGIEREKLYILPDETNNDVILARAQNIVAGENP